MVKKASIILMALGALIILVAVIPSFYITIPGTEKVGKQPLLIAGVTLIIIGALLMKSKPKQKSSAVRRLIFPLLFHFHPHVSRSPQNKDCCLKTSTSILFINYTPARARVKYFSTNS